MKNIEIYIRHNMHGAMLHLHVPSELKDFLVESIKKGECDLSGFDANFEISIPQGDISPSQEEPIHFRTKLSSISVIYNQE